MCDFQFTAHLIELAEDTKKPHKADFSQSTAL